MPVFSIHRHWLILAAAFLAVSSPSLHAHKVVLSNLYVDIELSETELMYDITSATFQFPPLEDVEFGEGKPRPSLEERRKEIETFFKEKCPLKIDGVDVAPILKELTYEDKKQAIHLAETRDFVNARMILHFPVKHRPKEIDMRWGFWVKEPPYGWLAVADADQEPRELDLMMFVYGVEDWAYFSPSEPQFVWHAQPKGPQLLSVRAKVGSRAPPPMRVPLASVAVAVALVAFLLATRKRRVGVAARAAVVVAGLAAMFLARGLLPVEVARFWNEGARLPGEEEAVDIFKTLHQNIYRAFDYEDEDGIYDALSQSVAGELLDTIYNDVYQSLILRDDGGAVARIDKIDILECTARKRDDRAGFDVDCHWRAHGMVKHYGHTHRRINKYRATYSLASFDGGWKISGVNVTEKARINPQKLDQGNEPVPLPTPDLVPVPEGFVPSDLDPRS